MDGHPIVVARIRLRDAPLLRYSANHGKIRVDAREWSVHFREMPRSTLLQLHARFFHFEISSWHAVTHVELFGRVEDIPVVSQEYQV